MTVTTLSFNLISLRLNLPHNRLQGHLKAQMEYFILPLNKHQD